MNRSKVALHLWTELLLVDHLALVPLFLLCIDFTYLLTYTGTAAMRNTKRGSWYIEALTSVFAEDSRNTHVADMLVKVSWDAVLHSCFSTNF